MMLLYILRAWDLRASHTRRPSNLVVLYQYVQSQPSPMVRSCSFACHSLSSSSPLIVTPEMIDWSLPSTTNENFPPYHRYDSWQDLCNHDLRKIVVHIVHKGWEFFQHIQWNPKQTWHTVAMKKPRTKFFRTRSDEPVGVEVNGARL